MKRIFLITALIAALLAWAPGESRAQDGARQLNHALARMAGHPKYRGRVLGTHIRRNGPGRGDFVYEVRVLRPDDRVILVFVDPRTGQILGDTAGR